MNTKNTTNLILSHGYAIQMSALKVRRVIETIRGRSYEEAIMILRFLPYRACEPILRILASAAANAAEQKQWKKSNLKIEIAYVDEGPKLKRFRPRAQGRGAPIQKPSCHITIGVSSEK